MNIPPSSSEHRASGNWTTGAISLQDTPSFGEGLGLSYPKKLWACFCRARVWELSSRRENNEFNDDNYDDGDNNEFDDGSDTYRKLRRTSFEGIGMQSYEILQ